MRAELLAEVQKLERQERASAFDRLGWSGLATLAALPYVNPRWITGGEALETKGGPLVRSTRDTISLVDPEDLEILGRVSELRADLVPLVIGLGEQLSRQPLPPVIARWSELAAKLRDGATNVADDVLREVREACSAGSPGQALDLVDAVEALGRVLGTPLSGAASISRQMIRRAYRNEHDQRLLGSCLPRPEPVEAFERLLGDDRRWALHYVGVGGVGKTTLIRHITTKIAVPRGLPIARIDFDYLSPNYPLHDPGRLIAMLLGELQAEIATQEQESLFRSLTDQLRALPSQLPSFDPAKPFAAIESSPVASCIAYFGSLLLSFRQPILIMDTCEELSKLEPIGHVIPSVEATFGIIERLHKIAPGMRVVLAGRRLLIDGGAEWTAAHIPAGVTLSSHRDYLRLFELRGFTEREADDYIASRFPAGRDDLPDVQHKLRGLCPEDGRVAGLEPTSGERFSPFELSLQLDWLAEFPAGEIKPLADGIDPYTDHRIVRRMGALAPLLPAIGFLRRFDAAALALATGETLTVAREKMTALAGHEWIITAEDDERGRVQMVDPVRRLRLERYLQRDRADGWETVRARVADRFERHIQAVDIRKIPTEVYDAALRALPPDRALALWWSVERRVALTEWGWLHKLCELLTASHGAAESEWTLLGAGVRATLASATLHTVPGADVEPAWRLVGAVAHGCSQATGDEAQEDPFVTAGLSLRVAKLPDKIAADDASQRKAWVLARRAWLGEIAAKAHREVRLGKLVQILVDTCGELAQFGHLERLATCAIAAVEAVVDRAERLLRAPITALSTDRANDLLELCGERGPLGKAIKQRSTAMFCWMLCERIAALQLGRGGERSATEPAIKPDDLGDLAQVTECIDWVPPASLRDRLRLELVRLRFHDRDVNLPIEAWLADLGTSLRTLDADRLWSGLQLRRAAQLPVYDIPALEPRPVDEPARSSAHDRFPPAAIVYAELTDRGLPESRTHAAIRARCRRARRLREESSIPPSDRSTDHADFAEIQCARALILGREAVELEPPSADVIESWPYQGARTHADLFFALTPVRANLDALRSAAITGTTFHRAIASAVLEEAAELSRFTDQPIRGERLVELAPETVHPDLREDVLRLQLRAFAAGKADMSGVEHWREVATLAHEEAELLSLRFADRAQQLFTFAADQFTAAGDKDRALAARLGRTAVRIAAQEDLGADDAVIRARETPYEAFARTIERVTGAGGRDDNAAFRRFERGPRHRLSLRLAFAGVTRAIKNQYLTVVAIVAGLSVIGGVGLGIWYVSRRWVEPTVGDLLPASLAGYATWISIVGILLIGWLLVTRASTLVARGMRAYLRLGVTVLSLKLEIKPGENSASATIRNSQLFLRGNKLADAKLGRPGEWPIVKRDREVTRTQASIVVDIPVPIEAPPALAPLAWEAALYTAAPKTRGMYTYYRAVGPVRRRERLQRIAARVVASPSLTGRLESSWAAVTDVLHVVARPVRTSGELRMDVVGSGISGSTIGARDVEAAGIPFVLLQGDPTAAAEIPTDASRLETCALRELAIALVAAGAQSVLVVPALPEATLHEIALELAETFRKRPPVKRDHRFAALKLVREVISKVGGNTHAAAVLETTLFEAKTS